MDDNSGIMGGAYLLTEWLMRFVGVNVIWFVINIPVGLVLFNAIMTDTSRFVFVFPIITLASLLFFPSTMALYATVRDWIIKKEIEPMIKIYFGYFKENYLHSFLSGLIWSVIWFVWLIDLYYFSQKNQVLMIIFLMIGMLLLVFNINYFSISTHYCMKIKDLFKNAFYITIANPLSLMMIIMTHFILIFLAVTILWFLTPLLMGTISAFISFLSFYRFSIKMKDKGSITQA